MSRLEARLLLGAAILAALGIALGAYAGATAPVASVTSGIRHVWLAAWEGDRVFGLALRVTAAVGAVALLLSLFERFARPAEVAPERHADIRAHARDVAPIDQGTDEGTLPSRRSSRPPPPPIAIDLGTPDELGLSPIAEQELDRLLLSPRGLLLVASRQSDLAAHAATLVANRRGLLVVTTVATREAAAHALSRATSRLVVAPVIAVDAADALATFVGFAASAAEAAPLVVGALALAVVPKLCTSCRQPRPADPALIARFEALGLDVSRRPLYEARGCGHCGGRGNEGERNVGEVAAVDPAMRAALAAGKGASSIAMLERGAGHAGLREEIAARIGRAEVGADEALAAVEQLR